MDCQQVRSVIIERMNSQKPGVVFSASEGDIKRELNTIHITKNKKKTKDVMKTAYAFFNRSISDIISKWLDHLAIDNMICTEFGKEQK